MWFLNHSLWTYKELGYFALAPLSKRSNSSIFFRIQKSIIIQNSRNTEIPLCNPYDINRYFLNTDWASCTLIFNYSTSDQHGKLQSIIRNNKFIVAGIDSIDLGMPGMCMPAISPKNDKLNWYNDFGPVCSNVIKGSRTCSISSDLYICGRSWDYCLTTIWLSKRFNTTTVLANSTDNIFPLYGSKESRCFNSARFQQGLRHT